MLNAAPDAVPTDERDNVRLANGPATAVAVKVTGEPVSEPEVALKVFAPVVVPNVHEPTVAIPLASVVAVVPVAEPPPDATANVTLTPDTGLPPASVTTTDGGVATAVPIDADWLIPEETAIVVAEPDPVGVIGDETADVKPVEAKVRV